MLQTKAMFRVMPTGKLRHETPDSDVERTFILVEARSNSDSDGSLDQWWRLLDSSG
jgi:hypothetical protein